MYPGGTFEISANVSSNDRYLSLDINDIPVLAGNLHDFLIPGRSDRFKVKSQEDGNSTLVTLSVINVTYADSGVYRWYFFGQGEFGWVNLVLAGESWSVKHDQILKKLSCQNTLLVIKKMRYLYYIDMLMHPQANMSAPLSSFKIFKHQHRNLILHQTFTSKKFFFI